MAWPNHDLNLAQLQPQTNAAGKLKQESDACLGGLAVFGWRLFTRSHGVTRTESKCVPPYESNMLRHKQVQLQVLHHLYTYPRTENMITQNTQHWKGQRSPQRPHPDIIESLLLTEAWRGENILTHICASNELPFMEETEL
ncbi:hypothetical protein NQZ68_012106 [Dissostichus eleginoides]|nr:hypothetical protein NQZ68_012106 [Dissostichus eleginoides]